MSSSHAVVSSESHKQTLTKPLNLVSPFEFLASRRQRELFSQMCSVLGNVHHAKRHLLLTR